jgi:hypothetical protein
VLYRFGGCSQDHLGRVFGVSQTHVGRIVRRVRWRNSA